MSPSAPFQFDQGALHLDPKNDRIVTFPPGLHDRRQIFAILQEELPLPSYFGQNWDALAECLKDLSWVREKRVALVHKELPHLSGHALALYLDVLADSAADWKLGDQHELLVVFPATAREAIETIRPA